MSQFDSAANVTAAARSVDRSWRRFGRSNKLRPGAVHEEDGRAVRCGGASC